jgi:8-oxo-dGTP diphosphatase
MKEVTVGILIQDGLVLACQRKTTAPYPLKWEFPGGKIEPGESPRTALIRELQEELSVTVEPATEFFRQEWDYGDQSFRVYYYCVRSFSGIPQNMAFEQIRWVKPETLLMMDILDGNREVVNKLVGG